jgi:hypothetical protein
MHRARLPPTCTRKAARGAAPHRVASRGGGHHSTAQTTRRRAAVKIEQPPQPRNSQDSLDPLGDYVRDGQSRGGHVDSQESLDSQDPCGICAGLFRPCPPKDINPAKVLGALGVLGIHTPKRPPEYNPLEGLGSLGSLGKARGARRYDGPQRATLRARLHDASRRTGRRTTSVRRGRGGRTHTRRA